LDKALGNDWDGIIAPSDFAMDVYKGFERLFLLTLDKKPYKQKVVKYRIPIVSTSKVPDHPFKFAMGYSVEGFRGEQAIFPRYKNGRPKHRLAGLMYIVMHDLEEYTSMEESQQIVSAMQHYKSDELKLDSRIANQQETIFFGGISGKSVALVVPLIYLNFKNELYKKIFGLEDRRWKKGKGLNTEGRKLIQQLTSGNQHTKEFKILLNTYLPFVVKLADSIAKRQSKVLCYIDAEGKITRFSLGYIDKSGKFCTKVQQMLFDQTSPKTPEGKKKTPRIERAYSRLGSDFVPKKLDFSTESNQTESNGFVDHKLVEEFERKLIISDPIRGLTNIGNTCYFNATMQALCASPILRSIVANMPYSESLPFNLARIINQLFIDMLSVGHEEPVNTEKVFTESQEILEKRVSMEDESTKFSAKKEGRKLTKEQIQSFVCQMRDHSMEHDAGELITYMLDLLKTEALHKGNTTFEENFELIAKSTTQCKACDKFGDDANLTDSILKVTLSGGELTQCIEDMLKEEILPKENRWNCGTKNCIGGTAKQIVVEKLPRVLIMQLNRFENTTTKIMTAISYLQKIKWIKRSYQLKAVINHKGNTPNSGHYTATVLGPDNSWYIMNDGNSPEKTDFVVSNDAYILVYEEVQTQ
jgi:ubiquitin C-terminal hydrolase